MIFNILPESKPFTVKTGYFDEMFACKTWVCWSNISIMNHWRCPPSNPIDIKKCVSNIFFKHFLRFYQRNTQTHTFESTRYVWHWSILDQFFCLKKILMKLCSLLFSNRRIYVCVMNIHENVYLITLPFPNPLTHCSCPICLIHVYFSVSLIL